MVVSAGCSTMIATEAAPTVIPTSTPEKLRLINGDIDACLLITPLEVQSLLGIAVATETQFLVTGTSHCIYRSVSDPRTVFQTEVITDATLKRVNSHFSSAVEAYEGLKDVAIYPIDEIENLGDRAYSTQGVVFLVITVLDNNIYYAFVTSIEDGIGYEALAKLVEIALQKMP